MTTLRPFKMEDLFKFNNINLDVLTETYNMSFYMSYMSKWPEAFTGEFSTLQKDNRVNNHVNLDPVLAVSITNDIHNFHNLVYLKLY
jgi:hypothetical protein